MRRQRLPIDALNTSRGSALYHEQSLASAASGPPPVLLTFPDNSLSIASSVKVSSLREGFLPPSSRASTDEEFEEPASQTETIVICTPSQSSAHLLRIPTLAVCSSAVTQFLIFILWSMGEVADDGHERSILFASLFASHVLFVLGIGLHSSVALELHRLLILTLSVSASLTSIWSPFDLVLLFLNIPVFIGSSRCNDVMSSQFFCSSTAVVD